MIESKCVCERVRGKEKGERETDRQTDRQRYRESERITGNKGKKERNKVYRVKKRMN